MLYRNSEMLKLILDKYKIYKGKRIDLVTLENISKTEGIEIKDLLCLLEINAITYYRLRTKKQKYTKLKFIEYQSIKDKKIIREGKINKEKFKEIINKNNIRPYTLLRCLGISRYNYYKMINNADREVKIIDIKLKHKVDLIKIDLKYLKGYGSRYYPINELNKICKSRKIKLAQFIEYYSKNVKRHRFNQIVIEKSKKGLWIGKCGNISKKFMEQNNDLLRWKLKKVIHRLNPIYGWKYLQDDLIQQAILKIYEGMRRYS